MSSLSSLYKNKKKYTDAVKYYELNKDKPLNEWLEFVDVFPRQGKQGLAGLFRLKNQESGIDSNDNNGEILIVFKVSQYLNYLAQHEYIVMRGLNDISEYCPHFCRAIGMVSTLVDPACRKEGNPFEIQTKYPICKDIMLCEYVDKSCKFYNHIRADPSKIPEEVLYTTIEQVLMGFLIAQQEKRFTHYDPHSFNIRMQKCDKNTVFLYVVNKDDQYCVPTRGHYPVLIDFGFSYISDMDDGPLWPSMSHTAVGFTSDRFDWSMDPRLFLVTVSYEIKQKRGTKMAKKFRRMVKNMFCSLDINWGSGWDGTEEEMSVSDVVVNELVDFSSESKLFAEYDYFCIDILQSLIIMPIENQPTTDLKKSFGVFIKEWIKIENEITSPFYNIYMLKCVVDSARLVRAAYSDVGTRDQAVDEFKNMILDSLGKITRFCTLKGVHYEKLLCSLYVFSKCLEGRYFKLMEKHMKPKLKQYSNLPVQSIGQIFATIQVNVDDGYEFSDKTRVVVFDSIKKTSQTYSINDTVAQTMNDTHRLCRGTVLYNMIQSGDSDTGIELLD